MITVLRLGAANIDIAWSVSRVFYTQQMSPGGLMVVELPVGAYDVTVTLTGNNVEGQQWAFGPFIVVDPNAYAGAMAVHDGVELTVRYDVGDTWTDEDVGS